MPGVVANPSASGLIVGGEVEDSSIRLLPAPSVAAALAFTGSGALVSFGLAGALGLIGFGAILAAVRRRRAQGDT